MRRVLGIDPGSIRTGFGIVESSGSRIFHVASGVLAPPRGSALPQRLQFLHEGVAALIAEHSPDCVALEEAFVGVHPRPALVLGQARGAIITAVLSASVDLFEYPPRAVKASVTGNGAARKEQVKAMVMRLLDQVPASLATDEADALAVAICHLWRGGLKISAVRSSRGLRG